MMQTEIQIREAIVAEALSWCNTPYHLGSRLKGVGCDCATLILQVMVNCGVFTNEQLGRYTDDWWLHTSKENYLTHVLRHTVKVASTICYKTMHFDKGNIVLGKIGGSHVYNHGAILIDYPIAVHAINPKVNKVNIYNHPIWAMQEVLILSPIITKEAL